MFDASHIKTSSLSIWCAAWDPGGGTELVFVKPVYKIAQHWRGSGKVLQLSKLQNKIWDMKHWNTDPHFGCLYESRCLKPTPKKWGKNWGTLMSNEIHPAYIISADGIWKMNHKSYAFIKAGKWMRFVSNVSVVTFYNRRSLYLLNYLLRFKEKYRGSKTL